MSAPEVLLLDGSMGHELKVRGDSASFATAMHNNLRRPELITAVHTEYVAAGCDVLTTNTFTLTEHALATEGLTADALPTLLHAACRCASAAAATATGGRKVRVAGCLPPLRHCYLPELVGSRGEMRAQYDRIVSELAPRVDMFIAETLCHSSEALAALEATQSVGKPTLLSLTLHDDVSASAGTPPTLRGGESIAQFVNELIKSGAALPNTLLHNCCAPSVITRALTLQPKLPAAIERCGGYANGFKTTTSEWLYKSGAAQQGCSPMRHQFNCSVCLPSELEAFDTNGLMTPAAYCKHAVHWVGAGGSIIGGCCGVGPKHMLEVERKLRGFSLDDRRESEV